MDEAISAAPMLSHQSYVKGNHLTEEHINGVRALLSAELEKDCESTKQELKDLREQDPLYQQDALKTSFLSKMAKHGPKHRKVGVQAVVSNDGTPILQSEEVGYFLGDYWGNKFSHRPYNRRPHSA